MTERVLAIVAHPDDESLGCGATLAKHSAAGDAVHVVAMTDGLSSRGEGLNTRARREQGERACKILGASFELHDFPDNRMDDVALIEIAMVIERAIGLFQPTIVYTHHALDLNIDHRLTHQASNVACRPQPGCGVKRVLYFEVPCSSRWGGWFEPNWYVDVKVTMPVKLAACTEYAAELREWPHPRSLTAISNLAAMRGASVGIEAAEAFMTGRVVA